LVLAVFLLLAAAVPASAHPLDEYLHTLTLDIFADRLQLEWRITTGPLLANAVWFEADLNMDGEISKAETRAYVAARVLSLETVAGDILIHWEIAEIHWPAEKTALELGEEEISFLLTAPLPEGLKQPFPLLIRNRFDQTTNNHWFYLHAHDNWRIQHIQQGPDSLSFDLSRSMFSDEDWLVTWDSGKPQMGGLVVEAPQDLTGSLQTRSRLTGIVQQATQGKGFLFFLGAAGVAILLGMLHAFSPGHGKSIVTAYMLGSKGNWVYALYLGIIVAITHTVTVIVIGLLLLFTSRLIMPTSFFPLMEVLSGVLILVIGGILIFKASRFYRKRAKELREAAQQEPEIEVLDEDAGRARIRIEQPITEGAPSHWHVGPKYAPRHKADTSKMDWKTLLAIGTSGGMVPCPDAVAIMVIAAASQQLPLGIFLISSFSIGIAVSLILIGLSVMKGRQFLARFTFFERAIPYAPLVSAIVIFALGIGLTYTALGRYQPPSQTAAPAQTMPAPADFVFSEAQIVFMNYDGERKNQLYVSSPVESLVQPITDEPGGVVDFATDNRRGVVYYANFDGDTHQSEIIQMQPDGKERKTIYQAENALLQGLVLTPDGMQLAFERISFPDEQSMFGSMRIWLLNLAEGSAAALIDNPQVFNFNAGFSHDMRWLSYVNSIDSSIYVYDFEAEQSTSIPNNVGAKVVWAPHEDRFLYTNLVEKEGKLIANLFLHDPLEGSTVNITRQLNGETNGGVWAPDGRAIAIVHRQGEIMDGTNILLYDPETGTVASVTTGKGYFHKDLSWSPDGGYLLYEQTPLGDVTEGAGLWIIKLESGEKMWVSPGGRYPEWCFH
jgi:ABC-type nickel/cobalt efflux system permease component RcnA/Tol biopolymer transport system component